MPVHRKEAILQSPIRFLDRFLRGGLGKGHLGVVAASPGVGKSACLVQLGLDALLRGKPVLHVAVGPTVDHVSAWYDAAFDELAGRLDLADRGRVREEIAHRRLIWSWPEGSFSARALEDAIATFQRHLGLDPAAVLVDGFDWGAGRSGDTVAAVKACAARVGAEVWMTAPLAAGRDVGPAHLVAALQGVAAVVDVALHLSPEGRWARVSLVKDLDGYPGVDLPLVLEGGTLRAWTDDETGLTSELPPEAFTLLASGFTGAEEEFGACAERWGVREVNFTFAGREGLARTRGLVELSEDELRVGEVSAAYVRAHLHRTFPDTPAFARVLQTIWHQVSGAGEVFAVGSLHADNTAHGGTGWAVELARHWRKPVHLFDQERGGWFTWRDPEWTAEDPPVVARARFAGTGTRSLSDDGRAAIRTLFERSFGPPAPAER